MRLEDEVDLARGELIAAVEDAPEPVRELRATVCWLGDRPARERGRFLLKHGTRTVPARLDSDRRPDRVRDARVAGGRRAARSTTSPTSRCGSAARSPPTPYEQCHATGAFILIDEATNDTVAAGMVASV